MPLTRKLMLKHCPLTTDILVKEGRKCFIYDALNTFYLWLYVIGYIVKEGARCSSVVRAFAHGAMGRRIDPSCGEPIELFLIPASAPQPMVCAILSVDGAYKRTLAVNRKE